MRFLFFHLHLDKYASYARLQLRKTQKLEAKKAKYRIINLISKE